MSGVFFGFSFEKISNLLYAILYGISYMLILGSFLYIDGYKMSNIKNRCFHIVGIIVLWIANILFFEKVSIAILFSFSLSIAICGAFFTIRKTLLEKTGDGSVS